MRRKNPDQLNLDLTSPRVLPTSDSLSVLETSVSIPTAKIYRLGDVLVRREQAERLRHVDAIVELVRRYE